MVQNLTSSVATNATEITLTTNDYPNLVEIIAVITIIITLASLLYKYAYQAGEYKKIGELIEAKFETLYEKYNTSEKIHHVELKIRNLESKIEMKSDKETMNAHVYEITNQLFELSEEVKELKKQNNDLKKELENHQNMHAPKLRGAVD